MNLFWFLLASLAFIQCYFIASIFVEIEYLPPTQISDIYIFAMLWCKALIFQTYTIRSYRNLNGLRHRVAKIWGLLNLTLWKKINSFVTIFCLCNVPLCHRYNKNVMSFFFNVNNEGLSMKNNRRIG